MSSKTIYECDRCKTVVSTPCAKVELYTRQIVGFRSEEEPIKQLIATHRLDLCSPCLEGLKAHLVIDGTGNKRSE